MNKSELQKKVSDLIAPNSAHLQGDAIRIIAKVLGRNLTDVMAMGGGDQIALTHQQEAVALANRVSIGEPLAYVLGYTEFLNHTIVVTPDVLIPRPETEQLALMATQKLLASPSPHLTILEIGTGSGCISKAIAMNLASAGKKVDYFGLDVSNPALEITRENLSGLKDFDNLSITLFDSLTKLPKSLCIDALVSNPPYIRTGDIKGLQDSVIGYEPNLALDGGNSGLDVYREIFNYFQGREQVPRYMFLELAPDIAISVKDLFSGLFGELTLVADLFGRIRYLSGEA